MVNDEVGHEVSHMVGQEVGHDGPCRLNCQKSIFVSQF